MEDVMIQFLHNCTVLKFSKFENCGSSEVSGIRLGPLGIGKCLGTICWLPKVTQPFTQMDFQISFFNSQLPTSDFEVTRKTVVIFGDVSIGSYISIKEGSKGSETLLGIINEGA